MDKQIRHFVSQRFGKATVCVEFDLDMDGVAWITLDSAEEKTATFTFENARLVQIIVDPSRRAEMIMRIAIGQAHKLYLLLGADHLFGTTTALATGTAPWIGDLTDVAYGGATTGYAADFFAAHVH